MPFMVDMYDNVNFGEDTTMRTDDCPVDLYPLHLGDDNIQLKSSRKNSVCSVTDEVQTSRQVLFSSATPCASTLPHELASWPLQPTPELFPLEPFTEEAFSQLAAIAAGSDLTSDICADVYPQDELSVHQNGTSARASPDISGRSSPYGSPGLSLSPLCYAHSGSLSTSPDPASAMGVYFVNGMPWGQEHQQFSSEAYCDRKDGLNKVPRHKRPSHIRAETKRRSKIQECFNQLTQMVPIVVESGSKSSGVGSLSRKTKAVVLSQTADYCRRLCAENKSLQTEADTLRAEMLALTADINTYHRCLPAEGVDRKPVRESVSIDDMFKHYLTSRSMMNWKFGIFGQFMRPLFASYSEYTSESNADDLTHSVRRWNSDRLTLVELRSVIFTGLMNVSNNTSILKNPDVLPEEIQAAILTESGLVKPSVGCR